MKLSTARLCMDCNEVFQGSGNCPACGYPATVALMPWVDTPAECLGVLTREEKSFINNIVSFFSNRRNQE